MKIHWKILIWLVAGVLVGGGMQYFLEAEPTSRLGVEDHAEAGVVVTSVPAKSSLTPGAHVVALVTGRGTDDEKRTDIADADGYAAAIARSSNGDIVWHVLAGGTARPVTLAMTDDSPRAKALIPFILLADMFLRLLKMLIVPIILTSIVCGVIGVGGGADLRRLGIKTFGYYIATSMIAIFTGLVLVNVIRPGDGAQLGLAADDRFSDVKDTPFWDIFVRMIPENAVSATSQNGQMLQVIFFALLFGYFVLRTSETHRKTMTTVFEAGFEVMMQMAKGILSLIPYGVFCLLVKVVGQTGFGVFKPLAVYMLTVTAALVFHSAVSLPIVLKVFGKVSPIRWAKAVSPALITAFSTSSSSMTLPVTMETVEKRGKVSNRVVSFVQPLGATINMDGTALYECIGVIFLAQYYASVGDFELSFGNQVTVVVMALMASIGAAGIPSAGLIMMVTILSALNLPVEGAALLLAVDRPLDMLRTVTNVFSDTCGAAVVARSEGETGPLTAGDE